MGGGGGGLSMSWSSVSVWARVLLVWGDKRAVRRKVGSAWVVVVESGGGGGGGGGEQT